jgi:hypothetical protein
MAIADKRDVQALSDVAEDLDAACEGCHLEFWYPGEKELMRRLRLRQMESRGQRSAQ